MLDFLVAPLSRIPHWDESAFVENVHLSVGGLAANTALCLAHLGAPVDLLACLGRDPFAELARQQLQAFGINSRYIRRDPRHSTSLAFGFVGDKGRRFFIVSRGANASLCKRDFQRIKWRSVSILHLGGYFHLPGVEPDLPLLFQQLQNKGIQTSLDLAWDPEGRWLRPMLPLLPNLDLIFPNQKQLQRLTEERSVRRGAQVLRKRGVKGVVVKLGARGCYVDSNDWQGFVPPFDVTVRDTTGAGDNFDAGFLYGLRAGWSLMVCARFANVVAAASTRAYGAAASLPSRAVAVRWMRDFYGAA